MSKSMYATMLDELTTKIKVGAKDGRKPTCSYSKSDLDNLTLAMLNLLWQLTPLGKRMGETPCVF